MSQSADSDLARPKKQLTEEQTAQVEALAPYLSMEQIADHFRLGKTTMYRIMDEQPEVSKRYKKGKAMAVADVASALLTKARDGDNACMMFYLKTQAGWRETQNIDHSSEDGSMSPSANGDEVLQALRRKHGSADDS